MTTTDWAKVPQEFSLRPALAFVGITLAKLAIIAKTAEYLFDGSDDDEDGRLGGAGDAPSGFASIDAESLILHTTLSVSLDDEAGDLTTDGVSAPFGIAPMAAAFATAAWLAINGEHDESEIAEATARVILRTASPVGELGIPEALTGQRLEAQKEAVKSLFGVLAAPVGELAVNRDAFGSPIYDESNDTRGGVFASADPNGKLYQGVRPWYREMFGENADTNEHLINGYLGGVASAADSIAGRVFQIIQGGDVLGRGSTGVDDIAKFVPGREQSTSRRFASAQFSRIMDDVYGPTMEHIEDLKREDGNGGKATTRGGRLTRAAGPKEREWYKNNPELGALVGSMSKYFKANRVVTNEMDEILDRAGAGGPVGEEAARLATLRDRKELLKARQVSYLGERFPTLLDDVLAPK